METLYMEDFWTDVGCIKFTLDMTLLKKTQFK